MLMPSSQNTQSFNQMQLLSLQPLREEITRFTKQLNDNHTATLTQHTALQTQIEQLSKLNVQLSNDAHNLTNALKGGNKAQGNWGEIILQRVFENSGLQEDNPNVRVCVCVHDLAQWLF